MLLIQAKLYRRLLYKLTLQCKAISSQTLVSNVYGTQSHAFNVSSCSVTASHVGISSIKCVSQLRYTEGIDALVKTSNLDEDRFID